MLTVFLAKAMLPLAPEDGRVVACLSLWGMTKYSCYYILLSVKRVCPMDKRTMAERNTYMGKKAMGILPAVMSVLLLVLFVALRRFSEGVYTGYQETYETYDQHYVMITDGEDSDFWNKVYESALAEARQEGVYIERFGEGLAVDYSRNELLKMAIQASVDGIIVPGDEDEETIALINEAVEKKIPVVTVLQDSTGSLRNCFVGNNNYNLGQEYGRQILELLPEDGKKSKVMVLVSESRADTSQNLTMLGIREALEQELGKDIPAVESRPVDNTGNFSAEESIRDIFLDPGEMPDILVCLNEVYTRCAYQAAVDYNQVGKVQILGYYDSETILNAVAKNIIYSTITLDAEQMGRLCVQALEEYRQTGYTNGYMAVDTRLITMEEAEKRLESRQGAEGSAE